MDIRWLVAQVFGVFGIIVFLVMYHFNKMKGVLRAKLLMDLFWATHYLLLGAYTGFATNVICGFREIVFLNNKKKIFKSKSWLWIFIVIILLTSFYTWRGWYSFIPAIVSTLGTISFWQKNVGVARGIGAINNVLMFTYDVFVGSYTGMLGEALAFVSVFIAIFNARRMQKTV